MSGLYSVPDRGRIIVVNFDLGGGVILPEMRKSRRPCLVIQNNKLHRGQLVTVIPLSTTAPHRVMPYHHKMDHRSFRGWPMDWGGQDTPRWAKCDYIATISLQRCVDPYRCLAFERRQYVKVRAIDADIDAVEKAVLWALGINV